MANKTARERLLEINHHSDLVNSPYIIYAYIDKKTNKIAYIGKDSNGFRDRRHTAHMSPSHKNEQKVNRVLQSDPERYMYQVVAICSDNDWMEDLEFMLINTFKKNGQCWLNVDTGEAQDGVVI